MNLKIVFSAIGEKRITFSKLKILKLEKDNRKGPNTLKIF